MQKLEYIDPGLKEAIQFDLTAHLPLYRLALYSNMLGKFGRKKKYSIHKQFLIPGRYGPTFCD
jgi:hypothetical protein